MDAFSEEAIYQDALRYRWLRNQLRPADPQQDRDPRWILPVTVLLRERGVTVDEAVDAAMRRWEQERGMRIWSGDDYHV